MAARKCAGCQAVMDADAIFCNECGLAHPSVQESVGSRPESEPADPAQPLDRPFVSPQPTIYASPPADFSVKDCPKCLNKVSATFRFCPKCSYDFDSRPPEPEPVTAQSLRQPPTVTSSGPESNGWFSPALTASVKNRYREGYLHARFLNGFGLFVIIAALVAGFVIFIFGVSVGGAMEDRAQRATFAGPPSGLGFGLGVIITAFDLVFVSVFVVLGIVIRAGAQALKASFDSAVNGSPFLTDADRAEMMSLPTYGSQISGSVGAPRSNIARFD